LTIVEFWAGDDTRCPLPLAAGELVKSSDAAAGCLNEGSRAAMRDDKLLWAFCLQLIYLQLDPSSGHVPLKLQIERAGRACASVKTNKEKRGLAQW